MSRARFLILALLFPLFFLNAQFLINDHIVSPKAADFINKIGVELKSKTKINGYIITTNDELKRGVSVYEYVKKYGDSLQEPFVSIFFAPNSKRIHLIAKPKDLLSNLDKSEILDYAIKVIASEDKNTIQSKYDVGLVQAYSEMADEIAKNRGVKLDTTIQNSGNWVLKIVNTLIIIGSLIVIWVYFVRPIIIKRRGK
jgi:hypothetical protein